MRYDEDAIFAKNFYMGYMNTTDHAAAEQWYDSLAESYKEMLKYPELAVTTIPALIRIQEREKITLPQIECAACGDTGVDEFNEPCPECQDRPKLGAGGYFMVCALLVGALLAAVVFL